MQRYPRDVVEVCACGWQLKRQSTNSKDYGMRKRLAQEAAFYDDYAESLLPEHGDQDLLELFAYRHNHRRFVRGKRADKAPIEILTGKELAQTWLDALLETA